MTREGCKELLPAMQHFANGGDLWRYDNNNCWKKQMSIVNKQGTWKAENIIEDKHFKARKAFALGGKIEMFYMGVWDIDKNPQWLNDREYRPKEPIYEWQYYKIICDNKVDLTVDHHTEYYKGWIKFEPSKRKIK